MAIFWFFSFKVCHSIPVLLIMLHHLKSSDALKCVTWSLWISRPWWTHFMARKSSLAWLVFNYSIRPLELTSNLTRAFNRNPVGIFFQPENQFGSKFFSHNWKKSQDPFVHFSININQSGPWISNRLIFHIIYSQMPFRNVLRTQFAIPIVIYP